MVYGVFWCVLWLLSNSSQAEKTILEQTMLPLCCIVDFTHQLVEIKQDSTC